MQDVRNEFVFLNNLRYSGVTNMFGAAPYLQEEFDLSRQEAKEVLLEWMDWTSEDDDNVMIGVVENDEYDEEGVLDEDEDEYAW
jgi:hypothetical protein